MFDGFMGNSSMEAYTFPNGQIFITVFVYMSQMLLLRFLVAMFNNRYKIVFENLDFLKRKNIINLKNSSSYDKQIGAITTSFFPINILLLPFIFPILILKNDRLNDSVLKVEYWCLISLYFGLIIGFSIPILPILFLKSVGNSIYIMTVVKKKN